MTRAFDYATATPDDIRAEALRRQEARRQGQPIIEPPKRTPKKRGELAPITAPVEFFLPWSCLVRDNAKYAPAKRHNGRLALILTPAYRTAKAQMAGHAKAAMQGRTPFAGPVILRATMHEPDSLRRRDPVNYAKATHDALSKIVYQDDSQIQMAWWIRGTVDVDRPGLAVLVAPLTTSNSEGFSPIAHGGA